MTEPSILDSMAGVLRPPLRPIDKLLKPIQVFAQHRLAGAGLLVLATAVALVWANSEYEHAYHALLDLPIAVAVGTRSLSSGLHHWINDGLMSVFFFMVGLEIKREILAGELSTMRRAALPAIAAVGGMIAPALIYVAVNPLGPAQDGWGIPMATDIAFALGVLALLGDRVPVGLKVFLTALAIVDDIGAVLVIALFYTSDVSFISLEVGLACLVVSAGMNALGVTSTAAYFTVGLVAWAGFLQSGVHATIAALLMAMTIPARTRIDGKGLVERMTLLGERLRAIGLPTDRSMNTPAQQHVVESMTEIVQAANAPLQELEHALAGPVTFFILPIFALTNAGVTIHGSVGAELAEPIGLGVVLGLFVGKQVGIALFTWLAVRLRIADLPSGVTWPQIHGVAVLGGVGFTMSLFVAGLAFPDPAALETAKVGILAGSLVSGVVGWLLVRRATRPLGASA